MAVQAHREARRLFHVCNFAVIFLLIYCRSVRAEQPHVNILHPSGTFGYRITSPEDLIPNIRLIPEISRISEAMRSAQLGRSDRRHHDRKQRQGKRRGLELEIILSKDKPLSQSMQKYHKMQGNLYCISLYHIFRVANQITNHFLNQ